MGKGDEKLKYLIFKISDDKKRVEVADSGNEPDYEVFREKLVNSKDSKGKPAPRYAVYDVEYDLGGEGKRWVYPFFFFFFFLLPLQHV